MPIELYLAVNDDNGNYTGEISQLEVSAAGETIANFESKYLPDPADRFNVKGNKIFIGETAIEYLDYSRYVGNICWDMAYIRAVNLARLFNDLRDSGHWDLTEADRATEEIWNSDRQFWPGFESLYPPDWNEAAKLEALGYQPLFDLGEVK